MKGARNLEGSCGRQGYRKWVGVIRARGCFGSAWALVRIGHHHIDTSDWIYFDYTNYRRGITFVTVDDAL